MSRGRSTIKKNKVGLEYYFGEGGQRWKRHLIEVREYNINICEKAFLAEEKFKGPRVKTLVILKKQQGGQ